MRIYHLKIIQEILREENVEVSDRVIGTILDKLENVRKNHPEKLIKYTRWIDLKGKWYLSKWPTNCGKYKPAMEWGTIEALYDENVFGESECFEDDEEALRWVIRESRKRQETEG